MKFKIKIMNSMKLSKDIKKIIIIYKLNQMKKFPN